jgi:hypothetical protein
MANSAVNLRDDASRHIARAFAAPSGEGDIFNRTSGRIQSLSEPIDSETGTTTKSRNPYYVSEQLQELVLASETGELSTFGLTDFNATGTVGDRVTVVSTRLQGEGQSIPIAHRNEATGEAFFSSTEITKLVQPKWLNPKYFMPLVVICILTVGSLFVILLPCLLISGTIAKKRTARFIDRFRFE